MILAGHIAVGAVFDGCAPLFMMGALLCRCGPARLCLCGTPASANAGNEMHLESD